MASTLATDEATVDSRHPPCSIFQRSSSSIRNLNVAICCSQPSALNDAAWPVRAAAHAEFSAKCLVQSCLWTTLQHASHFRLTLPQPVVRCPSTCPRIPVHGHVEDFGQATSIWSQTVSCTSTNSPSVPLQLQLGAVHRAGRRSRTRLSSRFCGGFAGSLLRQRSGHGWSRSCNFWAHAALTGKSHMCLLTTQGAKGAAYLDTSYDRPRTAPGANTRAHKPCTRVAPGFLRQACCCLVALPWLVSPAA